MLPKIPTEEELTSISSYQKVLEAMKLETNIRAPKAGIIKELVCAVGDRIASGDLLFIMEWQPQPWQIHWISLENANFD